MTINTQFLAEYSSILKADGSNRGPRAIIIRFDLVMHEFQGKHGVVPFADYIRQTYVDAVNVKPNWGYKQLIKLLTEILRGY